MADVRLVVTEGMAEFLKGCVPWLSDHSCLAEQVQATLTATDSSSTPKPTIAFSVLRDCVDVAHRQGRTVPFLHEIVIGSSIYEEPYQPPPRNPELVARLQQLEMAAAEREYRNMTKDIDRRQMLEARRRDRHDINGLKQQLGLIANLFATFVGVAFFTFYASSSLVENHWAALAGTLAGVTALVAEMWGYVRLSVWESLADDSQSSSLATSQRPVSTTKKAPSTDAASKNAPSSEQTLGKHKTKKDQ